MCLKALPLCFLPAWLALGWPQLVCLHGLIAFLCVLGRAQLCFAREDRRPLSKWSRGTWVCGVCVWALQTDCMGKHGATYGVDMLWLLIPMIPEWGWSSEQAWIGTFGFCGTTRLHGLDSKDLPALISLNLACPLTSELASNLNHPLLNALVRLQKKYLVQILQIFLLSFLASYWLV